MASSRRRPPRRRSRARPRPHIQLVVDETIALFRWIAWVSEQIYGDDARGATRRWILRRLHRDGPLSVPALARARVLRRQSVQPVVDGLAAERLVELVATPHHVRSPRVQLTARGADLVVRMDRVDARILDALARDLAPGDLAVTAATLRTLRARFEVQARGRAALPE